jgi:hypothetical protein
MLQTRDLFDSLSTKANLNSEVLASIADALSECEEAVVACAAGMLAEEDAMQLRSAVNADLDCADVVEATRRVLTRGNGPDNTLLTAQLEACLIACGHSNEMCAQHAGHHEHCRICSVATLRAADACRNGLRALQGRTPPGYERRSPAQAVT